MEIKPAAQAVRRADLDQREAEQSSGSDEKPTEANFPRTIAKDLPQNRNQQNGKQNSGASMEKDAASVNNCGRRKRVQINRGEREKEKKSEPPAAHNPFTPENKFFDAPIPEKHERGRNSLGYPTASLRGAPEVL